MDTFLKAYVIFNRIWLCFVRPDTYYSSGPPSNSSLLYSTLHSSPSHPTESPARPLSSIEKIQSLQITWDSRIPPEGADRE